MKTVFAVSLVAAALAGGFARAETNILSSGQPVRSASGECWQAGPWSALAAEQCTPGSYVAEVRFGFDQAELDDAGRKVLDDFARRLLQAELVGVVATAHADRIGGAHYNALLSARRAEAIRAYLVEQGIPESVVQLEAKGAAEPATLGRCDGLGEERRTNLKLVACLEPDRRVEVHAERH